LISWVTLMADTHKKSILKAMTWRVLATITTIFLIFIFTGEIILSIEIGILEMIIKLTIYYLHERAWNRFLLEDRKCSN